MLLERAESAADALLPALFAEMNSTGHAGHCVYVARVIGLVFKRLGIRSEPLCVDYEFLNSAAVQQTAEGRALHPPAVIATTGSGQFDGYDHHVVTLVRDRGNALLLDPTIIQLERHIPDIKVPAIRVTLPWPRLEPLPIDLECGRLTYHFRPKDVGFLKNEQWTDIRDAKSRANAVLQRMKS